MPIVSISYSYLALMYKEERFIKYVNRMSFDISEIIVHVKSFLCLEKLSSRVYVNGQETCRKEVSFRRKCEEKHNWQLTM